MSKNICLPTLLEEYKKKWSSCESCALHRFREKPVLWKGSIPCEVAFIVEAPSPEDNKQGTPMTGPAGQLLDHLLGMLGKELSTYGVTFRYLICNLVACYPGTERAILKEKELSTCRPHITELLKIARPKLLIPLGTFAQEHAKGVYRGTMVQDVWSPAYLVRGGGIKGERYRITYNKISKAICKLYARGE